MDTVDDEKAEYCPPTVSNYVCTVQLCARLETGLVVEILSGRRAYKVFPCCSVTGFDPNVSYQIFDNGKIVVSGAASPEVAIYAIRMLVLRLSRLAKKPIKIVNFVVENIVAFGGFGFFFDQQKFFLDYQLRASPPAIMTNTNNNTSVTKQNGNRRRKKMTGSCYSEFHPRQFKGLQFFVKYPMVVILYDTGKYVVTGSRDEKDILCAVNAVEWSKYKVENAKALHELRAALKIAHKKTRAGASGRTRVVRMPAMRYEWVLAKCLLRFAKPLGK